MQRTLTLYRTALVAAATLLVAGCKKKEAPAASPEAAAPAPAPQAAPPVQPVNVATIKLGKQIDADKAVATSMTTFGPRDTIYASVATTGTAASANLTAKWTFQTGQLVDSTTETIAPTGSANTEFHISKRSAWPAGQYKVEIFLDGKSVGVQEFEVKKS